MRNKKNVNKKLPYKLVLIEWEDSALGFGGWKTISEQPFKIHRAISVGFLIESKKDFKVLYSHLELDLPEKDISGSGDISIPTSAIRKIKTLKY